MFHVAPNPVENFGIFFVDETSISAAWFPPSVGFFSHFYIEVTSVANNAIIASQKM